MVDWSLHADMFSPNEQVTGFFQQKPSKAESFSATVREAEETQEAHARRMQYGVCSAY